ncbi:hypothetical protein CMV37_24130 [Bacillus cereus]|nr:hypothetical protein CMV37_24130 [Bacillus cereus]
MEQLLIIKQDPLQNFTYPQKLLWEKKFYEVLPSTVAKKFQEAICQVKEKGTNVIVEYPLTINESIKFLRS